MVVSSKLRVFLMKILAIETSCDETALAVVEAEGGLKKPKITVLKELVSSQAQLHAEFGGVVPALAKREHLKNLPVLFEELFSDSEVKDKGLRIKDIDLIAVTVGPGLEPALWTGITFAQEVAKKYNKPLIGINHLHGHLYSFLLAQKTVSQKLKSLKVQTENIRFPAISLLVSGGHTILSLMQSLTDYRKLGETYDDAVGESFDKVARLLNLPYPGGPLIEKLAQEGDPQAFELPSPLIYEKNYHFSYSGLKTAVLYKLKTLSSGEAPGKNLKKGQKLWQTALGEFTDKQKADFAASFQYAAFKPLMVKTVRAVKEFGAKTIVIGGGVAANKKLPELIKDALKNEKIKAEVIVPPLSYCMDNGAMIAMAAYIAHLQKKTLPLEANGTLNI